MVELDYGIARDLRHFMKLLLGVIRFLCLDKLNLMIRSCFSVSMYYQIDVLAEMLVAHVTGPECSNVDSIMNLVNQCCGHELHEALEFLRPLIGYCATL
jgi:hypothetical protein